MEDNLSRQVSGIRLEISKIFSSPNSPISGFSSNRLPNKNFNLRISPKIIKHPKKEYLSLPNISVHRNPMSILSEKDIVKHRVFAKKRNI